MQGKNNLDIIITATAKGVRDATRQAGNDIKTGFTRGRHAVKAFNDTVGNGRRGISLLSGSVKTLLAGVIGFSALRNATNIMKDAENAAFTMQTSVAAANREFANVGSVSDWEQTIRRLSKELRIYSNTALKNAVSRTVDMTKRLGLSKEQMEEVIKRSADLGAGKVELEGAIERVTAALRGEAESAEYLGLTLNENYVKAWYEANKVTEKAWKDLTDLEKAQARYQVLLEQSNTLQGRAAKSANTFSGSLQEIRKEIVDAISNNKDLTEAMQSVATVIRDNAGEIGKIISVLVTAAARVAEFAIEWKKLLLILAGTVTAVALITKLVTVVKGLNAAFVVLTGTGILSWLGSLKTAITAVATQAGLAGVAMKAGLAAGAAWGAYQIGLAVKAFYDWRTAAKAAREAQGRLRESSDRLMRKLEDFKDYKLPDDMTGFAQQDLDYFRQSLIKAQGYWTALKFSLQEKAKKKTFLGNSTDEAKAAQKELGGVTARLREIQADLKKVGVAGAESAEGMKKPAQAVMATEEQLDEFEKKAKKAYENARKEAEKYAKEVIAWEEKIKYARLSTEDKIRELGRKGLSDEQAWLDKRKQAEEKLYAAKEALRKEDYELAEKLAKDAEGLYADLAEVVKGTEGGKDVVVKSIDETKKVAIAGVTAVGNFINDLYTKQKSVAENAKAEWTRTADGIQEQLNEIAKERETNVKIELKGLQAAQNAINKLTRPATKHVTVVTHQKTVEAKQAGGPVGLSRGAKLSGYGGGDRIRTLLEAGEFVIRKEAVRRYGAGLFHALNAMKLDLNGRVKAKLGGLISGLSIPAMLTSPLAFQGGGGVPSAAPPTESMTIRFQAGNVELPVTAEGPRGMTRETVKQFEKELIKLGMARR